MSVTDGLTEGTPEQDVNSLGGFEAALAGKGIAPSEADTGSSDTSIASGLTTEPAPGPARDAETGRFVPAVVVPDAGDGQPAVIETAPEADTSTGDPVVDAFLAKYNGDTAAALKAAVEAQSFIGRQGQELGQTREELAELRGQLNALQQFQQAAPQNFLSDEQIEEQVMNVAASKGYHDAATQFVNEGMTSGDERAYDTLLRAWAIEDPIGAQRYDLNFQLWKQQEAAKANAPEPAGPDPLLSSLREQQEVAAISDTLGVIAAERGDTWTSIAPFMDAAIDQVHPSVAALVAGNDAEGRLAGARIVADRAYILSLAAAPVEPTTPRQVAGAQVASASGRPAAPPAGSPEDRQGQIDAFKAQLLGTNINSISDGLTYGNK